MTLRKLQAVFLSCSAILSEIRQTFERHSVLLLSQLEPDCHGSHNVVKLIYFGSQHSLSKLNHQVVKLIMYFQR